MRSRSRTSNPWPRSSSEIRLPQGDRGRRDRRSGEDPGDRRAIPRSSSNSSRKSPRSTSNRRRRRRSRSPARPNSSISAGRSWAGKRTRSSASSTLTPRIRSSNSKPSRRGVVNQAVVYPRQVLESALKKKASAIILAHNHPSGHVRPSDADIRLTKTIQETAKVLDILVHDHIIVGENRFFSFREEGLMP